jgi:hypothetical protein
MAKYVIAAFPFEVHIGRTFDIFNGVFAGGSIA